MTTSHHSETTAPLLTPFDELEAVHLFGFDFLSCRDEATFADLMMDWEPSGPRPLLLVTPNVDIVVQLDQHPSLPVVSTFRDADLILPDGFPIVATSRLAQRPLTARLAGSTLFACLWPRLAATRRPVTVVAATSAIAERLAGEHSGSRFVVAPVMNSTPEAARPIAAATIDAAVESGSDFILIGIGFPKDAAIAAAIIDQWPPGRPAPLVACLGASAELYLGVRRRAPRWMQRLGLEWFFRFAQEPRRMFGRYFVRDLAFFPLAWNEIRSKR